MTDSNEAYVRKLNEQEVSPEDMAAVMRAIAEHPRECRSFEALVGLLVKTLPHRSTDYRVALNFRLQALDELSKTVPNLGGFEIVAPDGGHLVHGAILVAAAHCRLVRVDDRRVSFDEVEFVTEAMRAAETEGSG